MMAAVNKINSNVIETAYAEEATIKTLAETPVWHPLDVNTFTDFGGSISKVSRQPFRTDRMNRKGNTVDLDAAGTVNHDLVQAGLQDLLQGFFFADLRVKAEFGVGKGDYVTVAAVAVGGTTYSATDSLVPVTGTYLVVPDLEVATVDEGVVTAITINDPGLCVEQPTNPVATTSDGTGTGCTINFTFVDAVITGVTAGPNTYTAASGLNAYVEDDLVFAAGCTNAANNGLKRVTTGATDTLTVAETLVNETPPAAATLVHVGFQFATGDLVVDMTGSLPQLTTTTKVLTDFGLVPGEYIYIGGDTVATQFAVSGMGFARVRSIAAKVIVLDKCQADLVADDGAAKTIQVFFGRVLKNETGTDIVRRTYNIERQLGAPDDASPAAIQSEYLTGAVPNELTLNIPTADKAMVDMAFVAMDHEQRSAATGIKSGTRATAVEETAFNTSSNVPLINLAIVSNTDENPTPLFAYAEEMSIVISNNVSPDKAIGVLGGFDASHGNFVVTGNLTAFFADVASVAAVRDNSDVTLDMHLVKENAGVTVDIPLMSLGDGRLDASQNEAIKIPLTGEAAIGTGAITGFDHALLMCFWDYLPDAAAA